MIGVIGQVSTALAGAVEGKPLVAVMALLGVSAVLSALVDNVPYVATMAQIVAPGRRPGRHTAGGVAVVVARAGCGLGRQRHRGRRHRGDVVVLGLAARNGTPISFWQFTRYGIIVATLSIALAAPYLWVRYFVLA